MTEFTVYLEEENDRQRETIRKLSNMVDVLRGELMEAEARAMNAEARIPEKGTTKGGYVTPARMFGILTNCHAQFQKLTKIERIKMVRAISGLGLKDAKETVEEYFENEA